MCQSSLMYMFRGSVEPCPTAEMTCPTSLAACDATEHALEDPKPVAANVETERLNLRRSEGPNSRGAPFVHYMSIAEHFGYDPSRFWNLFWTFFFLRLFLGFAVGFDEIVHSFRTLSNGPAKHAADGRALRRANVIVTVLHVLMLATIALAAPYVPRE